MQLIIQVYLSLIIILLTSTCGPSVVSAKPTVKSYDLSFWEHVNKTCLSRECDEHVNIHHLQHLATHMNRAIDPCENFHEYACGQWKTQHSENTMMSVGEKLLTQKYQELFESSQKQELMKSDRVYEKLQQYYAICLNSEQKEKASWQAYVAELRAMGYLQFNNETHWLGTLHDLMQYSDVRSFISAHVERVNASQFTLNIYPHNVEEKASLTREIYDILKHYNYTNDSLEEVKKQFRDLEQDLENILNSSCSNTIREEDNECDLSETLTWQELLQHNSSTLNWELLLDGFSLELQDTIVVNNISATEEIKKYLDACSQRILLMYSLTRFINHLQSNPHNIIDKGSTPFSCLRHMRKVFSLSMNYLYDRVYYNREQRSLSDPVIESVITQLKQQFSLSLDSNDMKLSPKSLQYLKKKLFAVQLNIGNLPKNVTTEFYEEFISDLNVSPEHNFYHNHLQALQHFYRRQRLLGSVGKFSSVWYTFNLHMPNFWNNLDSTAYYFASANFIVLPFAYLQLPFYDHRFWPSLLYGDLSNTLGHELMHAFDSNFLMFDYGGNYNELESLDILRSSRFLSGLECLSKNTTISLGERIADISGTQLALRTFAKDPLFLKHNGKLFFLQFAQFFCGPGDLEDSEHDMGNVRLNYTLAHMPEFAEVFECAAGSPMNPVQKCKLW